ncbi:MAG: VWA domain-containing protein [Geminicoccaceae bacterium]
MNAVLDALPFFHFIRPWWLLLIPVMVILWWRIRKAATADRDPPSGLAPHLAAALTVEGEEARRFYAIDGVAIVIVLISTAAAGPTWSRVVNPLVAQTGPLAVALEVSETMLQTDVAPSRLERAKHKILDVMATRTGARTALIAYAGSAHQAVPLAEDPEVLKPFVEGLSPDVMPEKGQNATAALELARAVLSTEEVPGAILFVLDDLDPSDLAAFADYAAREDATPVVFLTIVGAGAAIDDHSNTAGAAQVRATPDGADVAEIERLVASAYRDALANDERQRWEDRGWILAWPAALLLLFWFRRGWTMRWNLALIAVLLAMPEGSARADGIVDWFFTPDQQGQLAFDDKEFAAAADHFEDPVWRGYAFYRSGQYAEAVQTFARLDTADAVFAKGMAHLKIREYRPGIAAFETALERDPDHAAAARNLEIARAILDYVEQAREQSDTGEESGIGADDVMFDNEAGRGTETTITGEEQTKMQTAEQWMRTVDTRTSDFLRIRFALEAAKAKP